MLEFKIDKFMASLKSGLPNANVRLNVVTQEQRVEGIKRLHELNQLKSKAVPLGSGSLQQYKVKP